MQSSPTARRALAVAALGTFLSLMVFTAPLATINATATSLDTGVAGRTWVLSSMSVGLASALLVAGAVADDLGRRRVFVAGMVVLAGGSLVVAVAPHVLLFVLARVVEGVGAAAVIAAGLGIIAHAFAPGPERAAASGVWGASLGAGIAAGPLLTAGLDRYADWRLAYLAFAALAVVLGVAGRLLVEESRSVRRGVDLPGAVLLATGTSAFLAALVEGRQGWGRPQVVLLLVIAAVLLTGFGLVQRRSPSAMLDPALLRHRPFVAATGAAFATGAGSIALFSFMPGFVGIALGIPASGAAMMLLVWSGTSVVSALLARRIPPRVPGRVQLAIGLAGVGIGQLALAAVGTGSTWRHFVPGLLLAGVASGVLNAALGREAVSSVPADRAGLGSGANNTARYIGSAVGVTLVAVIAARPGPGTPVEDLVHGWNVAAVVTGLVSLVGAAAVLACRTRRTPRAADAAEAVSTVRVD